MNVSISIGLINKSIVISDRVSDIDYLLYFIPLTRES